MRCQDTETTGSMEETGWTWPVWRGETENCSLRELALGSGIRDQGGGCSIWTRDTDLAEGSRASTARRQVRKREAFVELGGTFCPSRCWEMTIPLLPGRTRESGGVQFVVCKVQPTHTDEMPADRGVCGSPGAVSQGCQNPGRGGEDLPFRSSWNSVSLQCLGAVLAFPKMFS